MPGDRHVLHFTKHEAVGNDFLVLVDPDDEWQLGPDLVRALCHRHFGVGADGVLRAGPGREGAAVSMELWNADGSAAEMSGNGIRCLVQAVVDAGLASPPEVAVATATGVRLVEYREGGPAGDGERGQASGGAAWAEVEMGTVALGDDRTGVADGALAGAPARLADVGNLHLVVMVPDAADPGAWAQAPALVRSEPGGVNVELVSVGGGDAAGAHPRGAPGGGARASERLTLRVLERGAGETLSCGTGSCAAAAVARSLGLVGDRVAVRNPGGLLEVTLSPADGPLCTARLAGPVRRVARVEVEPAELLGQQPAGAKPVDGALSGREPAGAGPSGRVPAGAEPVGGAPSRAEPVSAGPGGTEPVGGEPGGTGTGVAVPARSGGGAALGGGS